MVQKEGLYGKLRGTTYTGGHLHRGASIEGGGGGGLTGDIRIYRGGHLHGGGIYTGGHL